MRRLFTRPWPNSAPLKDIRVEDLADRSSFFRFGHSPSGIDILPGVTGVDFDGAWERRVEGIIDSTTGLKGYFISRDDLIASKRATGRLVDLADVEILEAAAKAQEPEN